MFFLRRLVFGVPLVVDAGAATYALLGNGQSALGLHVVAVALAWVLTRQQVGGARAAALTAALLALSLPLVGCAILAFVAWPTWTRQRGAAQPAIVEVALPDGSLAFDEPVTHARGPALVRPIRQQLRDADSADERVRAVMALRHMDARRAVPLLRLAFAHTSEDVRLLAFAILEQREKRLRTRIKRTESRLTGAAPLPDAERSRLHRRLARDHWELVYGGFVSLDLEPIVLGKAREHADHVLRRAPDSSTALLLARIHLRQREPERAWELLEAASRAGAAPATSAPWFAEAAYQMRRFGEIPGILRGVRPAELRRPGLASVAAFWLDGQRWMESSPQP